MKYGNILTRDKKEENDLSFAESLHRLVLLCENYCNKNNHYHEAHKAILDLKSLVISEDVNLQIIKEVAEYCFYKKFYFRSMALFACELKILTGTLYEDGEKEQIGIKGIQESIWNLNNIVICLKNTNKTICNTLILPVMRDATVKIALFKEAKKINKVITAAWCYKHIGVCYDELLNYSKFKKVTGEGVQLMESEIGDCAEQYLVYGALLNNLATAFDRLGDSDGAFQIYEKALQAKLAATDWPSSMTKLTSIQQTFSNLALVDTT